MTRPLALFLLLSFIHPIAHAARKVTVRQVAGDAAAGTIEIRGVDAGPFDPALWEAGKLHLLPDVRAPLLEPRDGTFRNIYAPSVVQGKDGWDFYYGGWDGAPTGNDRIYRVPTSDFLTFGARRTIIEHGPFHHVCNVSAARLPNGSLAMLCTTFPDKDGLNKPAFFASPDGERWNEQPAPYAASPDDRITIDGYPPFAAADINGMNVLLHEGGRQRIYFCNFRDGGKVFRASGADGKRYTFEGVALADAALVNDVKKFRVGPRGSPELRTAYLMGLHANTDRLWYALSRDGKSFAPPQVLCTRQGDDDAHIVAVGFVVAGEQEAPGRRLLGFLYGAGAVPSLDANRIFARWLQKRVVLSGDGAVRHTALAARGPDRQLIDLPRPARLRLDLYAEDGATLLGSSAEPVRFEPGRAYLVTLQ